MKLQLGKSPETLEKERAEKQRKLEAEIQQRNAERQAKIQALHKIQTRNKILIISFISILFIAMMTFGIYNVFIKKVIPEERIVELSDIEIARKVNTYPSSEIEGYLSNNIQNLLAKYIKMDDNIESVIADKNSVHIVKIQTISNTLAQIDFSVDVTVKEKDERVSDPEVIAILQKNGLQMPVEEEPTTEEIVTEEPTTEEVITDENTIPEELLTEEEFVDEEDENDGQVEETVEETTEETTTEEPTTTEELTTEEVTTEETTEDDVYVIPGEVEYKDSTQQVAQYYLQSNTIYKKGTETTYTYIFTVPIEKYENKVEVDGTEVNAGVGYRIVGEMALSSFKRVDVTDFTSEIVINDKFNFTSELVDEKTLTEAQAEVDRTLGDLYANRYTTSVFENTYEFDNHNAEYLGLNTFSLYQESNPLGFNAQVSYNIKCNGVTYTINAYLYVDKSTGVWKITKFL